MQDTLIILNPAARGDRAKDTWQQIKKLPHAVTRLTTAPGDARMLAVWAVEQGFSPGGGGRRGRHHQ